jgi:thiol-disulfide isomerase/thioredoxin
MALTESKYFEMGTIAPYFSLLDTVSNQKMDLNALKGENGTMIMFICNHCPFVVHVNRELVRMANDYISKGINFIAISSNDVRYYPQDGPDFMKQLATKFKYPFAYLYDESQDVAKAYDAVCTPDFYLFDQGLTAVYHGQIDNSRPGNGVPVTGTDMRKAIDLLLRKETNANPQKPSVGCSIKWK